MESNTHLSTINRKICVYKSIVTSIDVDDFTVAHDITMQMQCTTYNCIDFGSVAIFVGGRFEWFEFFVKRLIPISWDRDLLTSYHFCTKKKNYFECIGSRFKYVGDRIQINFPLDYSRNIYFDAKPLKWYVHD